MEDANEKILAAPPDDSITVHKVSQLPHVFRQHKRIYIRDLLPLQEDTTVWFQKVDSAEALLCAEEVRRHIETIRKLGYEFAF